MQTVSLPPLNPADIAYVRTHFVPLALLAIAAGWTLDAIRHAIADGAAPSPTYLLPDGTEMVPPDYFGLIGAPADLASLPERFQARHAAACTRLGLAASPSGGEETWQYYLSGEFGACVKSVTPEAIVLKEMLVDAIGALLAAPEPDDRDWQRALRDAVDRLDAIEMPFAAWDEIRFGTRTSRARLIDDVRARFAPIFDLPPVNVVR